MKIENISLSLICICFVWEKTQIVKNKRHQPDHEHYLFIYSGIQFQTICCTAMSVIEQIHFYRFWSLIWIFYNHPNLLRNVNGKTELFNEYSSFLIKWNKKLMNKNVCYIILLLSSEGRILLAEVHSDTQKAISRWRVKSSSLPYVIQKFPSEQNKLMTEI